MHVQLLWSIHKTCGIKLVVTNAEYSPGTYHNMPGELQATIQLYDHSLGAAMTTAQIYCYPSKSINKIHIYFKCMLFVVCRVHYCLIIRHVCLCGVSDIGVRTKKYISIRFSHCHVMYHCATHRIQGVMWTL